MVLPLKADVVSVVQQADGEFQSPSGESVMWAELLRQVAESMECRGAFRRHIPCSAGACQPETVRLAMEELEKQISLQDYEHLVFARVDAEYKEELDPAKFLHKAQLIAPFWQVKPRKGFSELTDVLFSLPVHASRAFAFELERLAASEDQFDRGSLHRVNLPKGALYDVENDSNTRKAWNPVYRLLGRDEAKPEPWQLVAFKKQVAAAEPKKELTWMCTTKLRWHLGFSSGDLACRMQKKHYVLRPGAVWPATENGTMSLLTDTQVSQCCPQCLKHHPEVQGWVDKYR